MRGKSKIQRQEPRTYRLPALVYGFLLGCLFAFSVNSVRGAESTVEISRGANYRRIFVPIDSSAEWPIEKEHYLPISKSEFKRLVDEQRERQTENNSPLVRMAGSTYYAELVEDQILVGTAEIVVQTSSPLPRLLALSPFNLTVTAAFWKQEGAKQAKIGLWQGNAEDSGLGVLVSQPDTLRFDWQLRALTSNSSGMNFLLQVPIAVPQVLALVLPEHHTAVLSSGELFRTETMPMGKTRYWFQFAPAKSHRLKVLRQSKTSTQTIMPLVARTTSYRLDPEGLSFLCSSHFDAYEVSSRDLVFDVSSGAKVVSVDINQQSAPWHMDNNSDGTRLVIELKESGTPLSVDIRCVAQMQFDQTWQLPVLRPREVSWTEGTARLVVSPLLELQSIIPRQASLQRIEGLSQKQPAKESYLVQEWSEDALVEVHVGRRTSRLLVRTATTVDIDPLDSENGSTVANESTARTVAEFICSGRPSYQIEAEVSPEWSIEAIKAVPSSALGEWHILADDDHKLLRIQLNEPILPDSPLRLEIDSSVQKVGPLLPALAKELSPLRFLSGRRTRRLLLLRSRQRGQLELPHALDHARLAAEKIDPLDVAILPELGNGVLLDLAHLDEKTLVKLQSRSDRYHAEVNVSVLVLPNALEHHYRLDCNPISGVVSEVIVQFDQPLPDTAQWKLVGHRGGVVATLVDQIASENNTPVELNALVTYRLQLPVVVDGPFSLQTQYSSAATETQPCNLLYLPEAFDWRGKVVVRGPLDGVSIDDRLWTPLAQLESESDLQPQLPVVGCYRLGAHQTRHATRARPLIISRTVAKPADANLFAWEADIQSFHAADGTAIFVATYLLENSGSTGADIQLPPRATLQEAWLDQVHFEPREILADEGTCRFHFGSDQRYPTLAIQYAIRSRALQHASSLEPSLPECSFPVNTGRWTPWIPEQYVIGRIPGGPVNEPPWTQRLFGPLARIAGQSIFNPFRVHSWQGIVSAPLDEPWSTQRTARLLDSITNQRREMPQQSWGETLLSASIETATKHLLLVDYGTLRGRGIQATTRLADANLATSQGLSFVISPRAILLTTADRTAQWRALLQRTDKQGIFTVISKQLNTALENQARREQSISPNDATVAADFIGVDAWIALPTFIDPPWHIPSPSPLMFTGMGHRVGSIEFVGRPPTIVVYREATQRAQWHVIWLLSLILSTWLMPRYANQLVLLLGFVVGACLIVPPEWLMGFQAILLGVLAAFFLQIPLKKISGYAPKQPSTKLTMRAAALTILLGVVFLCSQARAELKADSADATAATAQNRLYRVLIPIDSKGTPQGDDVYVPETFLKELENTPDDTILDGVQCVLASALYQGELPLDSRGTANAVDNWSITLELRSFVANSEVDLPFRRDEAEWLEDAHRLDGFPVAVTWNLDGNGCRVSLGATGMHRLELMYKPKVAIDAKQAHLKLHVPRLPRSRMDFSVPTGISGLKIKSAGRILIDHATRHWQAPLSAADVLQMSWTPAQNNREANSIGKVEQLAWLHVDATTVRLDVQIQVEHPTKVPEELVLEVSPELKLLRPKEPSPIDEIVSVPENPRLLRLKLKPSLGTRLVLPLRFELQRRGSLGRVFYPQIQIQGAATVRSMFAVSVSQGLSYEESLVDDTRSITAAKFASRWGSTGESPLFAYSQTNKFPKGSLRIWPGPRAMSVQQSMRVHCELRDASIEYEAAVDEITGSWLTHRLRVPANFTIEDVSVRRRPEMDQVAVRWSRVHKSQVVLFLAQPLRGAHVISLRGHLGVSPEGELTLPAISLIDTERSDIHVDLTRASDVLVSWVDPDKNSSGVNSTRMVRGRTKIPVDRWTWRSSGSKNLATLRVEKNDQQFTADTLTTIAQGSNGWTATLHSAIHVQKGVLSQVTLAVPNGFRPPYHIKPAGLGFEGDVRETASGRQITFLLSKPIAARKTFALHVSGKLDLPPNQRLEVPHLRLVGAARSSRYLLLPKRVGEQQVEWNWTDLKSKPLPDSLSHLVDAQENGHTFFVEKPQFFAQERSYQGPLQKADLRYAFISGTLDQAGNLSASAELVLQPGRATHCTLRLPVGAQLRQLVIGESRARREKVGEQSWRIPLGPPFLPRKIKVVYLVASPLARQFVRLTPPEVLIGDQPLPLPQTLWQIRPAGGLRLGNALVGHALLAEQFSRSAHQLPLETLNDSRLLALDLPISEGRSWFQPWQCDTQLAWNWWRAHEPSTDAIQQQSPTLLGNGSLAEEPSNIWSALISKLGSSKTTDDLQTLRSEYPPPLPDRPYSPLGNSLGAGIESCFMSSQEGQLVLAVASGSGGRLGDWLLAAAIVAGGVALLRYLRTKPDWHAHLCNRPHLVAIVGGLLCWLFLAPSFVGLLVVLTTLLSLAIGRGRSTRHQDSHTPLVLGSG